MSTTDCELAGRDERWDSDRRGEEKKMGREEERERRERGGGSLPTHETFSLVPNLLSHSLPPPSPSIPLPPLPLSPFGASQESAPASSATAAAVGQIGLRDEDEGEREAVSGFFADERGQGEGGVASDDVAFSIFLSSAILFLAFFYPSLPLSPSKVGNPREDTNKQTRRSGKEFATRTMQRQKTRLGKYGNHITAAATNLY